jgi:maltose O-acetyltransferase
MVDALEGMDERDRMISTRPVSRWNISDRLIRVGFILTGLKYRLMGLACGRGVSLYATVRIYQPARVSIGARSSLSDYTVVWGGGGVEIGSDVLISTHCSLVSVSHDAGALAKGLAYRQTTTTGPIRIGDNVWLGAGAVVLPGVAIGNNSIVGAGAVVTRDVAADCVAVGAPARVSRRLAGAGY